MLENNIKTNPLFLEMEEFASSFGLNVVEVRKEVKNASDIHFYVTLGKKNGEVSIDDCENFHRSVLPALELEYGREIISMEVSSSGVQRNLKDLYEFEVFSGKFCRIYSSGFSSWIEGTIGPCSNEYIELSNYLVVDTQEKGTNLKISKNDIQKAKLEYKWESAEDKKKKNIEKQKLERKKNKESNSGDNK